MKIGIFGGTFDPIHLAHLIIAQTTIDELHLDKVIFIPAKISPLKINTPPLFSDTQRLEMIKLATQDNNKFEVSDFEIISTEISYTYITIQHFHQKYLNDSLFLIIGEDSFMEFNKWKNYQEILDKTQIVVYPRKSKNIIIPEYLNNFKDKIIILNAPIIEISSTLIREKIHQKKEIRYFLHPTTYNYIKRILKNQY